MSITACLDHLEKMTVQSPQYPDYWFDFGLILDRVGRHSDALAAINRALELHPQYLAAGISRCFLLGETGKAADGFRAFQLLCARSPDDFSTIFALGVLCMRHGWRDTGLAQLKRAESMRPTVPYVLLATAAALYEVGDDKSARERIKGAQSLIDDMDIEALDSCLPKTAADLHFHSRWENPYAARVHVLRANFYSAWGEVETAENKLLTASLQVPGHAGLMAHMGGLLHTRDRLEEAEKWLSVATRVDPTCDQAHFELSFIHAENQNWEQALAALRAAVDLRPLFPDYHYHLGTLLAERDKLDEAIEEFRRVLTLNPSYGHATVQLAGAHLREKASEEALGVLATGTCADWPEALILSAEAHLMSGRRVEARCLLEKVLASDHAHSEAEEALRSVKGDE